mmetsp:Transcript_9189/g.22071  ORF Transcript_9189/g.22071 Transcript_9189/m.22071 type:complete len:606 (-) Transcript_9189:160-1977(-)
MRNFILAIAGSWAFVKTPGAVVEPAGAQIWHTAPKIAADGAETNQTAPEPSTKLVDNQHEDSKTRTTSQAPVTAHPTTKYPPGHEPDRPEPRRDDMRGKKAPTTVDRHQASGEHGKKTVHFVAANLVLPLAVVFGACVIIGAILHRFEVNFLPESAATLLIAVLFGLSVRVLIQQHMVNPENFVFVNSVILNLFLLPIIIFCSGWFLQRKHFAAEFYYILIFALAGTVISVLIIGYVVNYTGATLGWHSMVSLQSAFAFAALISAVDPVASLATYSSLNVDPLLNILVFGESTINDAVAIVLFNVFNEGAIETNVDGHLIVDYVAVAQQVAVLLFGSILLGFLLGFLLTFVIRVSKIGHTTMLMAFYLWASAYTMFAAAESIHLSGIICVLMGGIVMGAYSRQHFKDEATGEKIDFYLEACSKVADFGVFIIVGASVALIQSTRGFLFGVVVIPLLFIARACSVYPLAGVCNAIKWSSLKAEDYEVQKISWSHMFMMWHAGLRGGIALVLALEIKETWCPDKALIVNATFVVITILLIGLGGSTKFFLQTLGVRMGVENEDPDMLYKGVSKYEARLFDGLHTYIMEPALRADEETHEEAAPGSHA